MTKEKLDIYYKAQVYNEKKNQPLTLEYIIKLSFIFIVNILIY